MSLFRSRPVKAGLVVVVLLIAVAAMQQESQQIYTVRIVFGLKDQTPTDWNGSLTVFGKGEIVSIEGWQFERPDKVIGVTGWKAKTRNFIAYGKRFPVQLASGKPRYKAEFQPRAKGVIVRVKGSRKIGIRLKLRKTDLLFTPADLKLGQPLSTMKENVRIERVPDYSPIREAAPPATPNAPQDDFPSIWVDWKSGKHYLAWVTYQKEKDRVFLAERDGPHGKWSEPKMVAGPGYHFRVSLAGTRKNLWIVWSSMNDKKNWDLYARPLTMKTGKLGKVTQLTDSPGPDFWQRMITDAKDRAWVVWQGFRDGQSDIFARCADADGWHQAIKVSDSPGNDWQPCLAADPKTDRVWVGWDSYDRTNYAVRVRSLSEGLEAKTGKILTPEKTPLFQAHVSLCCDLKGRLWAAWDESGPQWGKDTGFLYGGQDRNDTTRLYASRKIRVMCLVDGQWQEPLEDYAARFPESMNEYNEYPQLQEDSRGNMWLAFRHRTCLRPREDGWAIQGRWDIFVTAYVGGSNWLKPTRLPHSGGRNDMRTDSQRDPKGNVYFTYASDNRAWFPPVMGPRNHHVAVSNVSSENAGAMKFTTRKRQFPIVAECHPREYEQVKRIRDYTYKIGDKTYHIYRGDLHRHTDLSSDGRGDGSIDDLHRYALDAAMFDFIMVGDHNMGQDNEYCWWQTQQANDLYTVPGKFISVYGYERSVRYPNGHRNILWAERGHKTLPLPRPLPALMKKDTPNLYAYLRRTNGICTLHTSATSQGTDWADAHDPELEPFVEIFQGYHTSYEAPKAPKTIDDKTDRIHGQYKADGFVSKALDKGYKLGFQASSDHISTHVSYACIIAEEFTRKGLLNAMRQRHSYAATDNIIMDVRMGDQLMGEEVTTAKPKLDVVILGTGPIERVEVLRNGKVVHKVNPKKDKLEEMKFSWADPQAVPDRKTVYYYVRVRQRNGQMAWASPIWVRKP